jgi:dGTPase
VQTIYATTRGVEIEAAGFEVLGGLLDLFVSALNDIARAGGRGSPRSHKLLQLVPPETRAPQPDAYLRLLKMLDFVSGMTDGYAVSLYKKVRGISLARQ